MIPSPKASPQLNTASPFRPLLQQHIWGHPSPHMYERTVEWTCLQVVSSAYRPPHQAPGIQLCQVAFHKYHLFHQSHQCNKWYYLEGKRSVYKRKNVPIFMLTNNQSPWPSPRQKHAWSSAPSLAFTIIPRYPVNSARPSGGLRVPLLTSQ